MIRTQITPQQGSILIPVPLHYIGKEVEVLVYTMDELQEEKPKANTMAAYKGLLTKEEAMELQQNNIKNEGIEAKELPKKQVSFNALSIDTINFKFDRNEANER